MEVQHLLIEIQEKIKAENGEEINREIEQLLSSERQCLKCKVASRMIVIKTQT